MKAKEPAASHLSPNEDILQLSPEIKKRIEKGKEDIQEGRYVEDCDVRKRLSKIITQTQS